MRDASFGDLTLSVAKEGDTTVLKWIGESTELDPAGDLEPFFAEFLSGLAGPVIISFTELKYMNSSTIQPITYLLKSLDERKIKTEIQFDKNSSWQNISFTAMQVLTKVLKSISIRGV